jgi:wyosine [tRNA(Phe)-imidazoG37] synthetase (radical SAM superfamily)
MKINEKEQWRPFPPYMQIETVSICNARCVMCLTKDCRRESAFMSDEIFEKIATELEGFADHIKRITIQAAGEPLLDRQLENRIERLKAMPIAFVAFATNGSLMDSARAHTILASEIDEVCFSVDGATKQTYEKIRVGLHFEKVMSNIESFLRIRDQLQSDTIVRLRLTAQKENKSEIDDFVAYWSDRLRPDDSVYAKLIHTWGNSDQLQELPEDYDYDHLNNSACHSPCSSLVIFSDGRVPLCCCDYNASICLGNVMDQSIYQMWQSETIEKIREIHAVQGRKGMRMCVNCAVWDEQAKMEGDKVEQVLK